MSHVGSTYIYIYRWYIGKIYNLCSNTFCKLGTLGNSNIGPIELEPQEMGKVASPDSREVNATWLIVDVCISTVFFGLWAHYISTI